MRNGLGGGKMSKENKVKGVKEIAVTYGETVQVEGQFYKYGVSFTVDVENASISEANDIYLKVQENLVNLIDKAKD